MLEWKISKLYKRDCELMVLVVDIKLLILSESIFYIRFLKVGYFKYLDICVNDFIIVVSYF